ncbi:hypothetical protein ACT17Q_15875 [Cellulomonas sp. CW35]|uniref:hypothetical protein n=1 Tax=Cellulomonas sp. CW35 TaxID=3458249 RepID=UPI0040340C85
MGVIVWTELRRSVLGPGTALLAVAQIALMLNDVAAWRGVWPMASAAVGAPWLFLGPVAAGLSAYDTLRRTRHQSLGAAGVGWRVPTTAMLLARVAMAVAVVTAGVLCAVVVNLTAGAPSGFVWPSYLVVALAFAVGSVAVGMLLGCLGGPLWFAPVIAVLLVFLRAAWFQGVSPESSEAALTRIFLAGRPWDELNTRAVVGAVLETGVVVAVALALPVLGDRLRARRVGRVYPVAARDRLRGLAATAVIVTSAVLVLASPPIAQARPPASNPLCSETRPRVCVWPEDALLLPGLAEKADRAGALADQVGGRLRPQLDEFGLSRGDNFVAMGQGTWFFSDTLAAMLASSLAPVRCDPPPDHPALGTYYEAEYDLTALFQLQIEDSERPAGYGDSSGTDLADVMQVWRADADTRDAWVAQRVATMESAVQAWCT